MGELGLLLQDNAIARALAAIAIAIAYYPNKTRTLELRQREMESVANPSRAIYNRSKNSISSRRSDSDND